MFPKQLENHKHLVASNKTENNNWQTTFSGHETGITIFGIQNTREDCMNDYHIDNIQIIYYHITLYIRILWLKVLVTADQSMPKPKRPSTAQKAMNWSMGNVQIIEQAGDFQGHQPPEAEEEPRYELSTVNMERIVLQSEVPKERTCVIPKTDGSEITPADLGVGCRLKTCITCSARDCTSGFKKE
eukprot:6494529-Heterocapsa_arctica.AAC.1